MTSGSPSAVRGGESDAPPGVPAPKVGIGVLKLGSGADLQALLATLLPASQEYGVPVALVVRALDAALPAADALLQIVPVEAGSSEESMRRRALEALSTDIVVLTSDVEPLAADWAAVLPRLAQVVVSREEEVSPADWYGVLGGLGAAEPDA